MTKRKVSTCPGIVLATLTICLFVFATLILIAAGEMNEQKEAPVRSGEGIAAAEKVRHLSGAGYSDDIATLLPDRELKEKDGHPVIDHTPLADVTLESLGISPDGNAYCAVVRSPGGSYLAVSENRQHPKLPGKSTVSAAQGAALCLLSTR